MLRKWKSNYYSIIGFKFSGIVCARCGPRLPLLVPLSTQTRVYTQPHRENSKESRPLGLCTRIFPDFVVSASRKPSLISFHVLRCIHNLLETPPQWNLAHRPSSSCVFSTLLWVPWGQGSHVHIFVPPVSLSDIYWAFYVLRKRVNEQQNPEQDYANFTSWGAQEYFLHPPPNYCPNWHSFL